MSSIVSSSMLHRIVELWPSVMNFVTKGGYLHMPSLTAR